MNPDAPGGPGRLRRDLEEQVDELELRLGAVERQLADRTRLALDRTGLQQADNPGETKDDGPSEPSDTES